jgi:hypothetical protein
MAANPAATWWVVGPPPERSGPGQVVQVANGSAEYNALLNFQTLTIHGHVVTRYYGPFASEADAKKAHPVAGLAWIGTLIGAAAGAGGAAAGGNGAQVPQAAAGGSAAGGAAGDAAASGINAIGDFFNRLSQANTWLRVVKVVVGGALLLEGILRMTGAQTTIVSAAKRALL